MRTYNIPSFVPHRGCPFDCAFCNQRRITGASSPVTAQSVSDMIKGYLKTIPDRENAVIEAAFFGGSFTGIPINEQSELLSAAYRFIGSGEIDGIRLSTRPDYINREILDNLKKYGVTTIELGVQSTDSEVLLKAGRGHTAEDAERAAELIREYGFTLGVQMMTGLPGDTNEKAEKTAAELINMRPSIARIYPTLILRDTRLEEMYLSGEYTPQTVEEAVSLCKTLTLMFEKGGVRVIRMGLQSTSEICERGSVVAGPVHSAFGELVENAIYYDIIERVLENIDSRFAVVAVNSAAVSKAVGNGRRNIIKFKNERNIDLKIKGDKNIGIREAKLVCC